MASPEPLVRFLAERIAGGVPAREPLLEVLARRHYREYTLHDLRPATVGGRPLVTADYTLDDRPTHLVSTIAAMAELPTRSRRCSTTALDAGAAGHQGVVDLYLAWPRRADTARGLRRRRCASCSAALPFAHRVRRVAVAVARRRATASSCSSSPSAVPDRTARSSRTTLVRGLHPMVGRRLDLWRLRDFDITRLDAPDDVLLYRCVAPDNRVRRAAGGAGPGARAVHRPRRRRAGHLAAAGRARDRELPGRHPPGPRRACPAGARLDMNHVWLHIWPVIDAPVEELTALRAPSRR